MSIGSTIKRLRREKDITQEQLADYLGITSRAISQWECDRTTPDISLIPALCHIFDVSSDVLLGIDVEKNNAVIQNYLDEAQNALHNGMFDKNVEILRQANRKFPRSYKIMAKLADALLSLCIRSDNNNYQEVFDLCHRILSDCTDSFVRYEAIATLGVAYGHAGKEEDMLQLAKEMPHAHNSYEKFMLYRWKGDADLIKLQEYIFYLINQLIQAIDCLSRHRHDDDQMLYSIDEQIELNKHIVDLLELFYSEGDYQYMAQYGEIACEQLVMCFLKNNDHDNVWLWLNKSVDFAIHMDTYDFAVPHTALILRGYLDGGWIMEACGNRSQLLLDWLNTAEEFEILRSDTKFDRLISRLKKFAKKP
jgi:transcriptional regulator with XRE-family HTH domain